MGFAHTQHPASPQRRAAPAVDVLPPGHRQEVLADRTAARALRPGATTAGPTPRRGESPASTVGGGRPLDRATRAEFEARFGANFGDVRVHAGGEGARATRAMGARAVTVGKDIAFDDGEFSPTTQRGRELLAHELAHTLQQAAGRDGRPVARAKLKVQKGVELDTKGFSVKRAGDVYTGARITQSSLNNEIFSGLFASPRTFEVAGMTTADANQNLDRHITARMGVLDFASKKKYAFGAGTSFRMNPDYWQQTQTGGWQVRGDVNRSEAVSDLNVHPEKYAIACFAATALTMEGGGKSPVTQDTGVAADDWIPGDWGYVKNTKFGPGGAAGAEGENIIYAGKGKYWGHFGPGNTYKTLAEWTDEVNSWNKPAGGAAVLDSRRRPTVGLF